MMVDQDEIIVYSLIVGLTLLITTVFMAKMAQQAVILVQQIQEEFERVGMNKPIIRPLPPPQSIIPAST